MLSNTWAAKASTKYEVYMLLQTQVKCYLPRCEHVTICKFTFSILILSLDFLKDIISGAKKYVKQNEVKNIFVPQYEGLTLHIIWRQVKNNPDLKAYFPDLKIERDRLPKYFICNLLATLAPEHFSEWVLSQVEERNTKIAIKSDKLIAVDKEIG